MLLNIRCEGELGTDSALKDGWTRVISLLFSLSWVVAFSTKLTADQDVRSMSPLLQSFFRSDRHPPLPSRRGPKRELEPCSLAADPGPTKTAVVSRPFPVGARSVPLSYVRSSLLIHREQHHAGSGYVEILAIFWRQRELLSTSNIVRSVRNSGGVRTSKSMCTLRVGCIRRCVQVLCAQPTSPSTFAVDP